MYQALYRKYRPRTFSEVVGQSHITDVLSYAVQSQNISHAYLFCGSRGTGKTTCAKILARAVNCLSPVNGSPCGTCEACLLSDGGSATDIVEMDAASNNGVNDVRDIRDAVVYAPSQLKNRVYIIDEVHMLSASAFNALLKTLEEPPANVIFILATTELQKLPATIISRCQRFDFRRITTEDIADHLSYVASQEQLTLDRDAAFSLARLARGGMRDAIGLLELNVRPDRHITADTVREVCGIVGRGELYRLVCYIAQKQSESIFDFVDHLYTSSKDISAFWQELIGYYRDLLVVKTASSPERYLDVTQDELCELKECAKFFSYPSLLWQAKVLSDASQRMMRGDNRRIDAELTLLRLTDPDSDASPEALAARLRALEDKLTMGAFAVQPVKPATNQDAPEEEKPILDVSVQESIDWKSAPWLSEIIHRLEDSDPSKAAFLQGSKLYFCPKNNRVRLVLPNALAERMLNNDQSRAMLMGLMQNYETVSAFELCTEQSHQSDTTFHYIDEIIEQSGKDESP